MKNPLIQKSILTILNRLDRVALRESVVVGRKAEEVIALLNGVQCRNGTSCPDQLARALESEIASKEIIP